MTAAQLRDALATLLDAQLGTYTWPNGSTRDAINLGEPPSNVIATGVEVLVNLDPEYANEHLHTHTAIGREHIVRVIPHGNTSASSVVERICSKFETSNPITVPASEQLGIGVQYTLRVRS